MKALTERELKIMRAIAKSPHGCNLDTIAARLGYRPAHTGRLAVRKTLTPMLRKHGGYQDGFQYGENGRYVGRNPAADQWDTEKWFLTVEGRAACDHGQQSLEESK